MSTTLIPVPPPRDYLLLCRDCGASEYDDIIHGGPDAWDAGLRVMFFDGIDAITGRVLARCVRCVDGGFVGARAGQVEVPNRGGGAIAS